MSSTSGSTGSSPPARRRRRRRSSGRGAAAAGTTPDTTTNGAAPAPQDPPTGEDPAGTAPARSRRRRGPRRRRSTDTPVSADNGTPENSSTSSTSDNGTGTDHPPQPGADGQGETARPRSGRGRRGRRGRGRSAQTAGQPQQVTEAATERPASGRVRAAAANSKSRRSGRRLRTVDETSAGGLVVDTESSSAALIGRLDRRGRLLWSLPKGHLEAGETAEQAAIREVAEETGINGRVLAPLGTIDYWFVAEDRRVHKTVHHFLMEAIGGELCDEDIEVTEVAWVPLHELDGRLAYADERKLVRLAAGLLSESA